MTKDTRLFIRFMPQTVPINLHDKITAALTAPESCWWFPHLTFDLAQTGWQRLKEEIGITELNYGTARVILTDPDLRRDIVYTLPIKSRAEEDENMLSVELLPKSIADQYKESGANFYTLEEFFSKGHIHNEILDCLNDAFNIIRQVPSLFETIISLVKSIHLIKPESDEYDVSFSEPHIPFSIFVSMTCERNEINALRVAEAIVHEAMHLQLTLIEKVNPLVFSTGSQYYSPWRGEHRNIGGVLHALYVFRVIECFFRELIKRNLLARQSADYLNERTKEFGVQVNEIRYFSDCSELTPLGKMFVQNLISPLIDIKDL